jgi:hypothetical protein
MASVQLGIAARLIGGLVLYHCSKHVLTVQCRQQLETPPHGKQLQPDAAPAAANANRIERCRASAAAVQQRQRKQLPSAAAASASKLTQLLLHLSHRTMQHIVSDHKGMPYSATALLWQDRCAAQ